MLKPYLKFKTIFKLKVNGQLNSTGCDHWKFDQWLMLVIAAGFASVKTVTCA